MSGSDVITTAVVQSGLVAAAKEMSTTLERAAYNPLLFELKDYSAAIVNAEGRLWAEAPGLIAFLSSIPDLVQVGLAKHAGDPAVVDRARSLVTHILDYMGSLDRQYAEQLDKTARSLQRLPSSQINWPEVHRFVREVRGNLKKLGKLLDRCRQLPVLNDIQRRRQEALKQSLEQSLSLVDSSFDVYDSPLSLN